MAFNKASKVSSETDPVATPDLNSVDSSPETTTEAPFPNPVDWHTVTQYEVAEYESDAQSVEVTYTDDQGYIYTRSVNIPRTDTGEVDQDHFNLILDQQLLGVNNKKAVGVAVFRDPNESSDDTELEDPGEEAEPPEAG